jgi:hypothetical protein
MAVLTRSRLPGIYFRDAPPQVEEALPRMDIAAFVGFASAGPMNAPVPVEDVGRFRDIFGDDLTLAWDPVPGRAVRAHLAPVVEAFFRNGGRRCWVVRVGEGGEANRFALPGLVGLQKDGWRPALADARAKGSWSDSLRVGTVGLSQSLGAVRFEIHSATANTYLVEFTVSAVGVAAGDLLRLRFGQEGPVLFMVVDSLEDLPPSAGARSATQRATGTGHWFLRRYAPSPPPLHLGQATLLAPLAERDQTLSLREVRPPDDEVSLYRLELDEPLEKAPPEGALLRVDFAGGEQLLLSVAQTEALPFGSPPSQGLQVTAAEALWPVSASEALEAWGGLASPSEETDPYAERLTFEFVIWSGDEIEARLGDLALGAQHPRFWGGLPADEELYRLVGGAIIRPVAGSLEEQASEPRFPLAGPAEAAAFYLPLGMPDVPDAAAASGPLDGVRPDTALARDGLERFSADLFVDPDLDGAGSRTLLNEANHKRYIRDENLRGLHSLLPLEEVTLVAVPDAVHRGWETVEPPSLAPLTAPTLEEVAGPDSQQVYTAAWSSIRCATTYTLEEASEPTFAQPVTRQVDVRFEITQQSLDSLKRADLPGDVLEDLEGLRNQVWPGAEAFLDVLERAIGERETAEHQTLILEHAHVKTSRVRWAYVEPAHPEPISVEALVPISAGDDCPRRLYYRVRLMCAGEVSPWSNTVAAVMPEADFGRCDDAVLEAPDLQLLAITSPPDDDYDLFWSPVERATAYTLEEARDPAFLTGTAAYAGPDLFYEARGRGEGLHFYRVRAEHKASSHWSSVRVLGPDGVRSGADSPAGMDLGFGSEGELFGTLPAPEWEPTPLASEDAEVLLQWAPVKGATAYELQEAAQPDFTMATTIYQGAETRFWVKRRDNGQSYYRVRALREEFSPWSVTVWTEVPASHLRWAVKPTDTYDGGDLFAVQRALLRFCAARGDLLALLSLPGHYRPDEALAHVAALSGRGGENVFTGSGKEVRVAPLTSGEQRALTFGALYHPWVALGGERRGDAVTLFSPPEGVVGGTVAARAIARGAWVAPANEPFRGVVSLDPVITREGWSRLFDAQVNVLRQDPRGFMVLSADTLGRETDLRPINVRRLLILLRRLALREGMTYVFQPNDAAFRRRVQHKFEQVLGDLYTRGAFVGDTPAMAYQVVTDNSVNTPASLEQGRFIIELRIAPSRPLAFLTVRLVQTDQQGVTIQEA